MPELVLGPLLRFVDDTSATVWVETDAPCTVAVLDARTDTFTVHGHHYALVDVTGLSPGTSTPYEVHLDGERRWPEPDSPHPQSRIRTLDPSRRLRLSFGSCRTSVPHDDRHNGTHGLDVLRAMGNRLTTLPDDEWPDLLLMLGDQVYADEPSEPMLDFIHRRRGTDEPTDELADFEEYTHLYQLAWSEPTNRWLLSTVPSMMIFDDHDVRDDWNTSHVWRAQMAALPWWHERVVGGLGSYWIYQHAGNLSIADRAADPLMRKLVAAEGDAAEILDTFASRADSNPEENRWSYARDIGRVRLVVLDSRCGRVLTPGKRAVLDDIEWAWFDALARGGDIDHLLIGTSLPYLLPRGLHELEFWNEAIADGRWGKRGRRVGEKIRQFLDLEHWAAFHDSFDAMAEVLDDVSAGRRGEAPASIVLLSGDVHHSYLMQAETGDPGQRSRIFQAVCSPIRNPLPRLYRYANTIAAFAVAGVIGRLLARTAGLREQALQWHLARRPIFDNAIATLDLDGRSATLRWETARLDDGDELPHVEEIADVELV